VLDRTNVRHLTPELVGGPVDVVVADLSFISLTVVIPALAGLITPAGDLIVLVKPQFEVGRTRVGSGGVVRSAELRAGAVRTVARAALEAGLGVREVVASQLAGRSGNVEYFLWLRAGVAALSPDRAGQVVVETPSDEKVER
jgi:23S rRNA (cytidine1920-2'-O)/16S rRNA (cytidine1409-2'-O)-methyltransferase